MRYVSYFRAGYVSYFRAGYEDSPYLFTAVVHGFEACIYAKKRDAKPIIRSGKLIMDAAKMNKDCVDKKVTELGVDLEKKMVLDPNKKMVLDPKKKMVVNRSYDEDLRLFERMCRNFCLEEIEGMSNIYHNFDFSLIDFEYILIIWFGFSYSAAAGYTLLEDDKTTTTRPAASASASAKRCQPKEEEEQQQEEEIEVVYDFKRPKLPLPPGRPFVRDGDVYIL